MITFSELGLSKHAVARVDVIGFKEPTEVQAKTIPIVLAGQDLMASAETGSGKTAAYALPIIEHLATPSRKCRALVLAPTRELAIQIRDEFERFSPRGGLRTAVLYGGTGYDKQIRDMRSGPDIVVATPGRLLDFIERRLIELDTVKTLVLDEADRLMDLGFMPQVRKVVQRLPKERQTIMFSATVNDRIERLGREFLINPARVIVKTDRMEPISIDQQFHNIKEFDKDKLLLELLAKTGDGSVLVFTQTRRRAKWVAGRLRDAQIKAEEIHGDISQSKRERTLDQYRKGRFTVLVATDVAARGLDIPTITHVVNYDLPTTATDYVHRIGRTGRAGRAGFSHTFVAEDDGSMLREIERLVGRRLCSLPTGSQPSGNDAPGGAPRPAGSRPGFRRFRPKLRSSARG